MSRWTPGSSHRCLRQCDAVLPYVGGARPGQRLEAARCAANPRWAARAGNDARELVGAHAPTAADNDVKRVLEVPGSIRYQRERVERATATICPTCLASILRRRSQCSTQCRIPPSATARSPGGF